MTAKAENNFSKILLTVFKTHTSLGHCWITNCIRAISASDRGGWVNHFLTTFYKPVLPIQITHSSFTFCLSFWFLAMGDINLCLLSQAPSISAWFSICNLGNQRLHRSQNADSGLASRGTSGKEKYSTVFESV